MVNGPHLRIPSSLSVLGNEERACGYVFGRVMRVPGWETKWNDIKEGFRWPGGWLPTPWDTKLMLFGGDNYTLRFYDGDVTTLILSGF